VTPKQPLANHQWNQLLDMLSLGDLSGAAFQRYERRACRGAAWHSWAYHIRSCVTLNLINRGVWV
jgi:hypothetical protein